MSLLTDLQLYKQQCFTSIQSPLPQFISFNRTSLSLNKSCIWKTVTNTFKTYSLVYKKIHTRSQTVNCMAVCLPHLHKGVLLKPRVLGSLRGHVLVLWIFWLIIRFRSQNTKQHCISFARTTINKSHHLFFQVEKVSPAVLRMPSSS